MSFRFASHTKFYLTIGFDYTARIQLNDDASWSIIINDDTKQVIKTRGITKHSILTIGTKKVKLISTLLRLKHDNLTDICINIVFDGRDLDTYLSNFFEQRSQKEIKKTNFYPYQIKAIVVQKIGDSYLTTRLKNWDTIPGNDLESVTAYLYLNEVILEIDTFPGQSVGQLCDKFIKELKRRSIKYVIRHCAASTLMKLARDIECYNIICDEMRKSIVNYEN